MKLRTANLRFFLAAGLLASLILALVLAASPRSHQFVHKDAAAAQHECAVTLIAAGNYQHTATDTIAMAPQPPPTSFAHVSRRFQLVSTRLDFSLLEHAPPAIS